MNENISGIEKFKNSITAFVMEQYSRFGYHQIEFLIIFVVVVFISIL